MKISLCRTLLLIAIVALAATACKSTKNVTTTTSGPTPGYSNPPKINYAKKVLSNIADTKVLTAKMKVNLAMGEKNVSLSGTMRMKRGDVIQLSMTFPLVGEVCRMEFTANEVLIVDRINSRYVRAGYDQIDFLRSANLDFSALEAIFWNEIFYPGNKVMDHLDEYTMSSAGTHTLLSLTTAPKLDYAFLTLTESALLDRITISSKNVTDRSNLVCSYGDFSKFASGRFPTHMQLNFAGDRQSYGLDISLNSLNTNSDWATRTTLSSKYTPMDVDRLFKSMIP